MEHRIGGWSIARDVISSTMLGSVGQMEVHVLLLV